jgi:hypothetical protein
MPLRVNMTGDMTGFSRMLQTAKTQANAFANSLSLDISHSWTDSFKGVFAAMASMQGLSWLKSGLDWYVDTGNEIKDISDQLGMSTTEWQKWADAVQRAGLRTEGFTELVERLKQKRNEALTDPKARAELSQLGFSDADITGQMSTSAFVQKALENSGANPQAQKAFADIGGDRGMQYTRALGYLPSAEAVFSPEDIKISQEAEQALHNLSTAAEKAGIALLDSFASGKVRDLLKDMVLHGGNPADFFASVLKDWKDDQKQFDVGMNYKLAIAMRDGVPIGSAAQGQVDPHKWWSDWQQQHGIVDKNDPMYAVLQQQQHDFSMQDQERQERVTDSERNLMTIGDRFKSIKAEMGDLGKQVQQHQAALAVPGGEGFLTDAQKQKLTGVTGVARTIQVNEMRQKYEEELANLQVRFNKDKADLKQAPLTFQPDNLARVGLYSASALRFNPVLGLQEKANELLAKIAQNTSKPAAHQPSDPHRR